MFARGNWAVFGIDNEQYQDFIARLNDQKTMLAVSQLAAYAVTRANKDDASGINPFGSPRLDESVSLDYPSRESLAKFTFLSEDDRKESYLPVLVDELQGDSNGYAWGDVEFRIGGGPQFAFWFVTNEWKDVNDLKSLKEDLSYRNYERPYVFLSPDDKKALDGAAGAKEAAMRKQFPVFIDFQSGRVYVQNSSKNVLGAVQSLLGDLGLTCIHVGWVFGENWLKPLLVKLYAESGYKDEFKRAADDAGRFSKEEREPIEDKELAGILTNFFSMTELETGIWAGMSSPAGVNIHKTMAPVNVKDVTSATTLLHLTDDASVHSAEITLQDRQVVTKKSGEERTFRKDIVTFELSDRINMLEAGAALLLGFDIPGLKKDIVREMKKSKQIPSIERFWFLWLQGMNNAIREIEDAIRTALEIKDQKTGILPIYGDKGEDTSLAVEVDFSGLASPLDHLTSLIASGEVEVVGNPVPEVI
jgi:hypothetical protein